ncbi:MAG: aldo/keto reductase [Chthoniobacteraceae bacterium]
MSPSFSPTPAPETRNGIPYRPLGRTGEQVSLIGLGGFHLGMQATTEEESIRIIRKGLDEGLNFLDNAWDYNNGVSELRMGKALRDGYRAKAFLMTKIDGRTKASAAAQIEESLRRLQTDCVDLMQFHEVIHPDDPERIFAPGGALEAVLEARQAGKLRFIGFTGHKSPEVLLLMLQRAAQSGFSFDTAQLPLNVMDAHFHSFEQLVLPELVKDGVGVLGMKAMGDPFILECQAVTAPECLRYAMSLPVSTLVTGCEKLPILDQALEAARTFAPLSAQERAALLERTRPHAGEGRFERYKTTHHFDSTVAHPEWLG